MEMTKKNRDLIITTLYEKCSEGEISVSQREKLIQKVNSMLVVSESAKKNDNYVNITNDTELSSLEKYKMFKESVYTKYSNGDITLEQREELLEKARDRFYEITE